MTQLCCKLCERCFDPDDQWYRPQLAKIEGKEVCLCRPCIIYVADIRDEIAKKAMKNDQKQT